MCTHLSTLFQTIAKSNFQFKTHF